MAAPIVREVEIRDLGRSRCGVPWDCLEIGGEKIHRQSMTTKFTGQMLELGVGAANAANAQ
jgi:hypothetical protein